MSVAGATRVVGSAVVRALPAAGHDVTGLVRDPGRATGLAALGADLRRGDVLDPDSYRTAPAEADAVVYAALPAVPGRLTRARSPQVFDADAVMTGVLAGACTAAGTGPVSTGGCSDRGDHGEDLIDEDTPLTPSPMGVGSARQAADLDRRHREDGLDVVRLSPGSSTGRARCCIGVRRAGPQGAAGLHRPGSQPVVVRARRRPHRGPRARRDGPPGGGHAVVDDEPLRLRELTDPVIDALGRPRVGTVPPALIGLLLGPTPVASLTTSVRVRGDRIRRELGCSPARGRFRDAVGAVAPPPPTRPARTVRGAAARAQSVAAWNSAPAGSASSDPTACRSCSVRCCRASSLGRGSVLPWACRSLGADSSVSMTSSRVGRSGGVVIAASAASSSIVRRRP